MTKWLALLMACLALGLVVAACGDDDDDDGGNGGAAQTTEEPAATTEEETGGAAAGETVEVTMKDLAFDPKDVEVAKGGTITWTNEDSAGHDVTKTGGAGPDFSSGDAGGMKQGDTFEQTFDAAGKIDYVCTVHPQMTATITVK